LVYGNLAVVTPGGRHCIVALNRLTGREVWRSKGLSDPAGYSSCIGFTCNGVPMIANMTAKGLVCVSAADGRFLWRNDRAAGRTAVCPTPAYADGYVFGASGYGNGGVCVKLSVSGNRVTATQAWDTSDMDCHHGGYVIVDGYIYGNHRNGWNCLELSTGRKVWGERGVGKGSVCYADGMLFTFSENRGRLGIAPANPSTSSLTGELRVQGTGKSWAHPVVIGGRLYVRYDDTLYTFDVRDPAYRPPPPRAPKPAPRPTATRRRRLPPRRPPRQLPPATPEVKAKRLLSMARNYLANGAEALATRKLKELLSKYPDTEAAAKAKRMLRDLE
jgi:outer membrane protein assembly factor BamB